MILTGDAFRVRVHMTVPGRGFDAATALADNKDYEVFPGLRVSLRDYWSIVDRYFHTGAARGPERGVTGRKKYRIRRRLRQFSSSAAATGRHNICDALS